MQRFYSSNREQKTTYAYLNKLKQEFEQETGIKLFWFSVAIAPGHYTLQNSVISTMATIKLTIIEKREYAFNDASTGEEIKGITYTAFNPQDKAITFSSQDYDHKVYASEIGYNPDKCESVDLKVKVWDGKVKYQENMDLPEDSDE